MNRRNFLNAAFTCGAGFSLCSRYLSGSQVIETEAMGTFSLDENRVAVYTKIPVRPIRMLHLTDVHLSMDDERGIPFAQFSNRMAGAYRKNIHFQTGEDVTAEEAFRQTLLIAEEQEIDFLALTGDIFSFPSEAAVEWAFERLIETGIPFAYVAGNHDWHYEGMEGSSEHLRETWAEKRLKPMYQGNNPLYASYDIGGIRFVCIDNSTYEILPDQIEYFRKQARGENPNVLMMNNPLFMPGRGMGCGCANPEWGSSTDKNYIVERRERWPEKGHTEVTMNFYDEVFNSKNLLMVLAGHTHRQSLDIRNGVPQVVSGHNATGYYLDITFDSLKHDFS